MPKSDPAKSGSNATGSERWVIRDKKSGRFVQIRSSDGRLQTTVRENPTQAISGIKRRPGRYKGVLTIGPEFFEPLSEDDLAELGGA